MRRSMLTLLATLAVAALLPSLASATDEFENYALESVSASLSTAQAGAHPDFTTFFRLDEKENAPYALTRDIQVTLPPGLFGNPQAFPACTSLQLGTEEANSHCPQDSQIG